VVFAASPFVLCASGLSYVDQEFEFRQPANANKASLRKSCDESLFAFARFLRLNV
jgi:hypothetical protein